MIITYERTVEYEIDVPPKCILIYAKYFHQHHTRKRKRKACKGPIEISLQDIIDDIAQDSLGIYDPTGRSEYQIGYAEPQNPYISMSCGELDPFNGSSCTIEELDENLKKFKEED